MGEREKNAKNNTITKQVSWALSVLSWSSMVVIVFVVVPACLAELCYQEVLHRGSQLSILRAHCNTVHLCSSVRFDSNQNEQTRASGLEVTSTNKVVVVGIDASQNGCLETL